MKKLLLIVAVLILMVLMAGVAYATDGEPAFDLWGFIVDEAYVLIPALYVVGIFAKKIPNIPDWTIPLVLLVLGVVGAMLIIGVTVQGAIQGVLVSGAAVFVNQLYKQTTTRD